MYIDGTRADIDIVQPGGAGNLRTGEDTARLAHEMVQYAEFCWTESELLIFARDTKADGIELDLFEYHRPFRRLPRHNGA